jgi:TonB family protein
MHPASTALIVFSAQVLLIVCAAALADYVLRVPAPSARLRYWRMVGALCLALPFVGKTSADLPAASVAFGALPGTSTEGAAAASSLPVLGPVLLWIWASGTALGLLWLVAGAWRLRQLRRASVAASIDPEIGALQASIAPRAEFRWSSAVHQPVTLGVRRPLVLLPRRFADLPPDAQRAVACHELLHVKRHDWTWTVFEAVMRVLFWFHPGVWWLVDRVQLLREQVIDELVIRRWPSRRDYMLALMTFAGGAPPTALSSAFLRQRHLKSRLRQLTKETHMSFQRIAWTMAALALVIGGVTAATVRALPLDVSAVMQGSSARLEIRLAEATFTPGMQEAVVAGSGQRIYLHPTALATGADVTSARVIDTGGPTAAVGVTFTGRASLRMANGTAAHLGRPVAIIVDGQVLSAPTVKSPISESAVLSGLTIASAQVLATRLTPVASAQGGTSRDRVALPVPVHQEKAVYTQAAMAEHIEGEVLLEVVVNADGSTGDITVVKSLDTVYGLDEQAVDALARWTWKPGTRDGQPVAVAVQVQMTFTLK